jgi:hypothetical protein
MLSFYYFFFHLPSWFCTLVKAEDYNFLFMVSCMSFRPVQLQVGVSQVENTAPRSSPWESFSFSSDHHSPAACLTLTSSDTLIFYVAKKQE